MKILYTMEKFLPNEMSKLCDGHQDTFELCHFNSLLDICMHELREGEEVWDSISLRFR